MHNLVMGKNTENMNIFRYSSEKIITGIIIGQNLGTLHYV